MNKTVFLRWMSCVLLAGTAATAVAQYGWIDKEGRKVFSDQPPPLNINDRNVLQRPAPAPASKPVAGAASAANPGAAAATDRELKTRLEKAENELALRRHADEQRSTRARADNCARAQQTRAGYASGAPLVRTDAQEQRTPIDEVTRATELERLDGIIASDCH